MKRLNPYPPLLFGLLLVLATGRRAAAEPTSAALAAFDAQVAQLEARLTKQHLAPATFLAGEVPSAKLRSGEVMLEELSPREHPPGALVHYWRGTAFVPGATAADFERLLRDFRDYPRVFAPEVVDARVMSGEGDRLTAWMRVRQKHVLTVVMDSSYDVSFGRLNAQDGFSASRSTRIYEIDGAGTAKERRLGPAEEHGFLWRLNSYWSYEERDGGLYLQVESVSLSRAIPAGLAWALRPYVESVPRESLEFTLRSAVAALRAKHS